MRIITFLTHVAYLFLVIMILGSPASSAAETLFLGTFPEFRQNRPQWVAPGVRMTYRMGSLSTSPNGKNATMGYYQVNIMSVEPNEVLCVSTGYNEQSIGNPEPIFTQREVEAPGIAQYWLHPLALQKAEKLAEYQEMQVTRLPYTLDSKVYQAAIIVYEDKPAKILKRWIYDTETGMLIHYYHDIQATSGYSEIVDFTFVGVRNVSLPRQNGTRPAWVKPGASLQLSGTYSSIAYGTGTYSLPYALTSVVESVGATWSQDTVTAYMNGQPQRQVAALSAIGYVGGSWLAPSILATLQTGMVLDIDNVTQTRTVVTSATTGAGGQPVVMLQEQGRTWSTTLGYDIRTGMLVYYKSVRPIGQLARIETELRSR